MNPPFRIVDLFSGAGGMSLGFRLASESFFSFVWANDFNQAAQETYNHNLGNHCYLGDITNFVDNSTYKFPAADIVIGGPPCQGFSLLNKNRIGDDRRSMWQPFLEVVERVGASIFVMENVPQLLNSPEHVEIEEQANIMGFQTVSFKICAADYGVPQVRWRAFIIGCKFCDPKVYFPPLKTHYNPQKSFSPVNWNTLGYIDNPKPWVDVSKAIIDLPIPIGTEMNNTEPPMDLHFGRNPTSKSLARYQAIPEQGMNRFDLQRRAPELTPECWIKKTSGGTDLFGRLWWDRPSVTIRTEFYKPEKGRYLHPEQHRPITHREAARLQSFPDWFHFKGSKVEIAKQIGNAVPPLLAMNIAQSILKMLRAYDK